jgi:hypothetical protein
MKESASSAHTVWGALRSACVFSVDGRAFAVVFKGALQYVVALNQSAETLVRIALAARSPSAMITEYAETLDIPVDISEDLIAIICDDWTRTGVIGTDAPDRPEPGPAAVRIAPPDGSARFDSVISIGGAAIRMVLQEAEIAEITAPMVAGNTVLCADKDAVFTIRIWKHEDSWCISNSDGDFEAVGRIEVARDRVLAKVMANSWPALADAPCLHGATLRAPNGRHVMVSGDSGRGKTTLALGLGKHSFTLLADDMSVFDSATGRLYPMKTNASVKEGAWSALSGLYSELNRQEPINVNGRLCKYVQRPAFQGPAEPHGVDALVFPKWRPGAEPRLEAYDSEASLLSMLRWSYLPQNQKKLQAMADFLSSLPLFELTYSQFDQADRLLLDLLECRS